jgi:hypothetical protein
VLQDSAGQKDGSYPIIAQGLPRDESGRQLDRALGVGGGLENASEITDDLYAQAVISALIAKYREIMGSPFSPGPDDVGLVDRDVLMELPIETITGRSSGSFFHISTRPGRL